MGRHVLSDGSKLCAGSFWGLNKLRIPNHNHGVQAKPGSLAAWSFRQHLMRNICDEVTFLTFCRIPTQLSKAKSLSARKAENIGRSPHKASFLLSLWCPSWALILSKLCPCVRRRWNYLRVSDRDLDRCWTDERRKRGKPHEKCFLALCQFDF